MVQNGRAVGVEVKGKDIIKAKSAVISAAGVEVTYRKLLDEVDVQKLGGVPQSLLDTESNGAAHHVYCFIGLDGDSKELGLPSYNVWSFPTACSDTVPDLSTCWTSILGNNGQLPEFLSSQEAAAKVELPAFLSFPSAKDPRYNSRNPGKATAVVLTESRAEFFDNSGPPGKRVEQYEKLKGFYKEALLNAFLRHFPHLKSKVSYVDVATPWSNEHYLGRRGSYGLDQDTPRFLDPTLSMKPPNVRGLYLTGQDFITGGVFAQPLVAWMTLFKVLGVTSLDFWILSTDMLFAVLKRVAGKAILGR
jgi:all-trans-retinol 13,14-reductase